MSQRLRLVPTHVAGALVALAAAAVPLGGCYSPALLASRGGLDSLRTQVDTLMVRDSVTYQVLLETRRELAVQHDVLLSTRATSGSTTQELFDQMSRLEGKLDEVMGRFSKIEQRPLMPPGTTVVDPGAMYDQAAQDLTQGHYALALQGFRNYVQRFPTTPLADNAQYGAGECFFAQAQFDSATVEYGRVETGWPDGDKVPAALYKLALCQEKLGRAAESKKTLQSLLKRFPLSGEAQLARERLGTGSSR